ncbi:MAG: multicopper oxidase domain-containing protein [Microthrixaceae bacterium]
MTDATPRSAGTPLLAMTSAVVVMALAVPLAAVLISGRGDNGPTAGATGKTQTVAVELGDLYVKPPSIQVPAGTELIVTVTNAGKMPHDLRLEGGEVGTKMLEPGATEEVSLGVIEASTEAWCTVPGHKEAGMVLAVDVGAATGSGGGSTTPDDSAKIDPAAEPAADWVPFDPALAPAPGGTEHKLTMRATEKVIEVAPGVTQEMWTFNDQVPGPVLRGKVGDLFTITLVNEGKLGHSIDFHSSKVAWNDEMRTIEPGESLVYQYVAKHAGVWMYHCGTAPALHHIGNGMFGAIIINPPDLPPVDHELVFVQSELYLGPDGQPGNLTKMQGEDFDAVVFNGYLNQYKFAPIRVEPGQRVRVWVLDAGPNENSAFHIVGTIFDTTWKEGEYLLRPGPGQGGSQVLDLQPAQGGFVEFSFDEAGLYPIVTHKFANVGKGALGLFQAGEVAAAGGGH